MSEVPDYLYFIETPMGEYQSRIDPTDKLEAIGEIYRILRVYLCTEGRIDASTFQRFNLESKVWEETQEASIETIIEENHL